MTRILLLGLTMLGTVAAADLTPFNGNWIFNPQKSKLEGQTMTFTETAEGMLVQSFGNFETTFRIDGKDYQTPLGYTVAWKEAGKDDWETVMKLKGKPLVNSRITISPDGKTMTVASEGTRPAGGPFKESVRYVRTAGEAGLLGTWRSENVDVPAERMTIKTTANDWTMTYPDWQASVTAQFDGKAYPIIGPTVPPGLTIMVRPVDSHTLEMETAKDGKPFMRSHLQVSADGRTVTQTATPVGESRKIVYIYEKQ
jgi:hypothetical protein